MDADDLGFYVFHPQAHAHHFAERQQKKLCRFIIRHIERGGGGIPDSFDVEFVVEETSVAYLFLLKYIENSKKGSKGGILPCAADMYFLRPTNTKSTEKY